MDASTPNASPEPAPAPAEGGTLVLGPEGRKQWRDPDQIRPYDFRQPASLAPSELRKLRLRHEEFVRSLASRLSMYLRLEVSLRLDRLQTLYYQRFTEGLGNPTHLTLFKAEPLKGIGLLDIPPTLGLAIVDRLLGGSANVQAAARDLTEIETALLDQVVQIILNEWCNHWQSFQDLRPSVLGHENQGSFLQTAPHDTVMACFALEMGIGESHQPVQLAFPHYMLEPIVEHLMASTISDRTRKRPAETQRPQWNPGLNDVPVGVTAEWSGLELSAREMVTLKPGQILMLDPQMTQQIRVRVASATKYHGRLGTCGGHWAVELTQLLPP